MRLFYDQFSSRRRADVLLLGADYLAVSAAVLFASGACYRGESLDVLLILVWALVPRTMARFLSWFDRPRDFLQSLSFSTVFVVFVTVLILAGWELVLEDAARSGPLGFVAMLPIFLAWGSGFLLCHTRAYLLHDFLLGAAVLVGLLEQRPQPYLWLPLYLLGFCVSASTRHLLYDVFVMEQRFRINLQNARAVALVAALPATACFLLLFLGLRPLLDQPTQKAWRGAHPTFRGGGNRQRGLPSEGFGPASEAGIPRQAYTQRFALPDLRRPLYDHRVVLSARVMGEAGDDGELVPTGWAPAARTLWKGVTFSSFDPQSDSWSEETLLRQRGWSPEETVKVRPPPAWAGVPAVRLEIEVRLPVFRNLVAPYFASELGPLEPRPRDGYLLENSFGDLFPVPPPQADARYYAWVLPWQANRLPGSKSSGRHPDPRFVELPPTEEVGIDLRALARGVFAATDSIHDKVGALRHFYREGGFRYANEAHWAEGARRLTTFLRDGRTGNCSYFATTGALLLRAAGVSTRVAVGFSGVVSDGDRYLVRNSFAHAWIEIYLPELGWFPVDPTRWVPPHPNYTPPPELAAAGPGAERPEPLLPGDERGGSRRGTAPRGAGDAYRPRPGVAHDGTSEARPAGFKWTDESELESDAAWVRFELAWGSGTEQPIDPEQLSPPTNSGSARSTWLAGRRETGELGMLGLLLRLALVVLAGIAAVLALVSFLRPRSRKGGEQKNEVDEAEEADSPDAAWSPCGESVAITNPREAILAAYQNLQLDLVRTRSHRRPHQTPLEHGRRFKGRYTDLDRAFERLHRLVYMTLYGMREATPDDVEEARHTCRRIRRYLA